MSKKRNVPTAIISEALGLSTENVTQVYLYPFDIDIVDKYHERIIDLI